MEYKYKQLERELAALSKVFSELGVRLTEVGKEVAQGVMPSDKLLDQISASRSSFETARTAVHGHASSVLVSPLPKLGELVSIPAIDALLKAAALAEETKFSIETERDQVMAILARVLTVTHRESSDFKPLLECHAKIRALRNAIVSLPLPHRHPESEPVTASKHPATALLSFVENLDKLDDDRWMALETTISESYGKPLFVAASRGKLAVPPQGKVDAPTTVKPLAATPAAAAVPSKPVAPPEAAKPVEKKPLIERAPEKPIVVVALPAAPIAPTVSVEKKTVAPAPAAPAPPAVPAAAASAEKKTAPQGGPAAVTAVPTPTHLGPLSLAPSSVTPAGSPVAAPPAVPGPVPVAAWPAPAALPQVPAANSLTALASATEAEKSPAASVDSADKQRKDPRLAVPTPSPISRPESKPREMVVGEDNEAIAGDGSQRPQRWGFWRGNR